MDKVDDIIIIMGKGRDSNSYIIGETLIDPGSGENIDYLKDEINAAGLEMTDIKKIVNTHCHFDHMGADKQLQDEYEAVVEARQFDNLLKKQVTDSKGKGCRCNGSSIIRNGSTRPGH